MTAKVFAALTVAIVVLSGCPADRVADVRRHDSGGAEDGGTTSDYSIPDGESGPLPVRDDETPMPIDTGAEQVDGDDAAHQTTDGGVDALREWDIRTLAEPLRFGIGSNHAIGFDDDDEPVALLSGDGLYLFSRVGAQWSAPEAIGNVWPCGEASAATDSRGALHVACVRTVKTYNRVLTYLSNASGAWSSVSIENLGEDGGRPSIAVDGRGLVHVVYLNSLDDSLRYATNASGTWTSTLIERPTKNPGFVAVTVAGRAHVIHLTDASCGGSYCAGTLVYATNGSGSWEKRELVEGLGVSSASLAICVDSAEKMHVAYDDGLKLWHLTGNGDEWSRTVVSAHPVASTSVRSVLAADEAGQVHLVFGDVGGALSYAVWNRTDWMVSEIAAETGNAVATGYFSLAVGRDGRVHVLFSEGTIIKHVTKGDDWWTLSKVAVSATDEQRAAFFLDDGDRAHIAYTGNGLRYLSDQTGNWDNIAVSDLVPWDERDNPVLGVETTGLVSVLYQGQTLNFATISSAGWTVESIARATRGTSGVATDSSGRVHVVYHGDIEKKDRWYIHAARTDGTWAHEPVGEGHACMTPAAAIAINPSNQPVIAFLNEEAFFAKRGETQWAVENVDKSMVAETLAPLTIDSSGFAHIVFYGYAGYPYDGFPKPLPGIYYATNASGAWTTTPIDVSYDKRKSDPGIKHVSTALDPAGRLHVAYFHEESGTIRYATNNSGNWLAKVVENVGDVGDAYSTSIKVDSRGVPRIVYFGQNPVTLKLASPAQ
jgi:hypothetical protein